MLFGHFTRCISLGPFVILGLTTVAPTAASQTVNGASSLLASRAYLEARALAAEHAADTASAESTRRAERSLADSIRSRLREGDFAPGDRVWISVRFDSVRSDTLVVRTGRRIQLPDLPDIDLTGVLRSELGGYLTTQLSRYVRNPQVRAAALIRIGVLGEVAHPGYFAVRADALLSDALSQAGGPTPLADVATIAIQRDGQQILTSTATRTALQQGATLDALGVEPGDEMLIRPKPQHNWTMVISTAAVSLGVLTGMLASLRR